MPIVILVFIAVLSLFIVDRNRALFLQILDLPPRVTAGLMLTAGCLLWIYSQMYGDNIFAKRLLAGEAFILLTLAAVGPLALGPDRVGGEIRIRLRHLVTRILWLANVVLVGYWLTTGRSTPLAMPIVIVEVLMLLLLYQPRVRTQIRVMERMPVNHQLFGSAAALTALLICIASPLAMYAGSEDFAALELGVIGTFCGYFALVLSALGVLYYLLDDGLRKVLTIACVFLCIMIFIYTGLFDMDMLDHFELRDPVRLNAAEQILEIAGLILLFALTAMATIYLTRMMTWWTTIVLVSVALTSIWTGYSAMGPQDNLAEALPADHEQIIDFSPERNVLVLMFDGFQGSYIEELMESDAAALSEYDGFVWYANTLSTHAGTWGSVPALVGGHRYTVEAINERAGSSAWEAVKEAYAIFPAAYIPAGYDVTYVNPQYVFGCEYLAPGVRCTYADPYAALDQAGDAGRAMLERINLPLTLALVSLFNAAPFTLKESIYDRGYWLGAHHPDTQGYVFKREYWGFLRTLTEDSHFDSDRPTFKFVQLEIPHGPQALTADCRLDPGNASYQTEVRCAIYQVALLLKRLKQAGAYAGTKIVLVSDHGWYEKNPMFPPDFEKFVPADGGPATRSGLLQPLMLVKDFNSTGPLTRSDVFLSNADVPAIVCSAVGSCDGVAPDPTVYPQADRALTVNVTKYPAEFATFEKFDVKRSYEVRESIFDPHNWRRLQ